MHKITLPLILLLVIAASAGGNALASIGALYRGSPDIKPGMLVSLDGDRTVVATSLENVKTAIGAVVSNNPDNNSDFPVEVATTGQAQLTVSDIHGEIKKGDAVSASSIVGVGAKNILPQRSIGIAQEDFNRSSENTLMREVTLSKGDKKNLAFGSIKINLNASDAPSISSNQDRGYLPQTIYGVFDSLAGRQISTLRATLALMVVLFGTVVSALLIYSSVQTSIAAIGRNPLAAKHILTSLLWVFAASAGIGLAVTGLVLIILRINF